MNSELEHVDNPVNTKRLEDLKCPSKIDLEISTTCSIFGPQKIVICLLWLLSMAKKLKDIQYLSKVGNDTSYHV